MRFYTGFWNISLANQLLKSCDVEVFLAYANGPITEKAVERWINLVSEETTAIRTYDFDTDINPSDNRADLHTDFDFEYNNAPLSQSASSQWLSTTWEQKLSLCLLLAASRGFLHCLRALTNASVSLGVSIANTSFHTTTFLQESVRSGQLGVVKLLLDRGVDPSNWNVNTPDWSILPISMAVQRLHIDIAAAILAYDPVPDHGQVLFRDDDSANGVRVDDIDYWCVPGRESEWRLERLRYEVDPKNDVIAQIGEFGFNGCESLELVSWAAYRSSVPMLKLLIERYSFSINLERDLHWALKGGGDVDVVRLLLQHGRCGTVAPPPWAHNFHPSRSRAPVVKFQGQGIGVAGVWSSEFRQSHCREVALRERVPVIDAVKYCNVDMVKLLLDTLSGEDVSRAVNEFDASCMTSLGYAVRKRDEAMVKYLLECGAEVWQSCFDLVMTEGSADMIGLLARWIKEHDLEVKKE